MLIQISFLSLSVYHYTSNPETLLQYRAARRRLLEAPTSRDESSVTTSPTSKIYNSTIRRIDVKLEGKGN